MDVCACTRVSAAPRHSWLGCWGVCVSVRTLPLSRHSWLGCVVRVSAFVFCFHLANPGWGLGVCVFVCAPRLHPASPGWGVPCGHVCLGSNFSCARPFTAGSLRCVGLCAGSACSPRILAGVRGACVSAPVLTFTPPILAGVLRRVCLCVRCACRPPVFAGVCGAGVCACVQVLAATRHSWLEFCGRCVFVLALPVPRQSGLRFAVRACQFGLWLSRRQSRLRC